MVTDQKTVTTFMAKNACTVTYVEASGTERTVTILGIDEADSLQGQVSWVSPIARTLVKSREGDELRLVTPAGVLEIEVLQVSYPAPPLGEQA